MSSYTCVDHNKSRVQMNKTVNIALSTANDFEITMVAMYSVVHYLDDDRVLVFHLLVPDDFTEDSERFIRNSFKNYINVECRFYQVGALFSRANVHTEEQGINIQTFYRLVIPQVVSDEKCLYLDSDIICCDDITELYDIDISDCLVAGVKATGYIDAPDGGESYCTETKGLMDIKSYINAGVLLLNLEALRVEGFTEKAISIIRNYYPSQDQDIVNILCYSRIKTLPYRYNVMIMAKEYNIWDFGGYYNVEEVRRAWIEPVIIHYCGRLKPWRDMSLIFADKWWMECLNTPVCDELILKNKKDIVFNGVFEKKHIDRVFHLDNWVDFCVGDVCVYGAGYVAEKILYQLEAEGVIVKAIVVTKELEEKTKLHGIPILSIDYICNFSKKTKFIVATTEKYRLEIIRTLEEKGFYNIIIPDDPLLIEQKVRI